MVESADGLRNAGLVLAIGGMLGLVVAHAALGRVLAALPAGAEQRAGVLERSAVFVIVATLVPLHFAREAGYGRPGIVVWAALLVVHWAVVAATRVRRIEALGVGPELARRHRLVSVLQAACATGLFAGAALRGLGGS